LLQTRTGSALRAFLTPSDTTSGPDDANPVPYVPPARAEYTLTRLHATGGIGRVWLARDENMGRDVALKELRAENASNSAHWARFVREARVTGQLEHPSIVPVYELGERPGSRQPFYVMRFIQGRTLSEAVAAFHRERRGEKGPALELAKLLTAFVAICNAVAYAHARGVVHRDLKGANVVLGDFGEVIVLDWGLAKMVDQPAEVGGLPPVSPQADGNTIQTVEGQVMGTPGYLAPEQAAGRSDLIDARTDVYGLGAILYEILTGRPPFSGLSLSETLRQVENETPVRPRTFWPGVPAALEAVCLRALAKKPEDRYPGARDLAEEIQRYLADEPVQAFREPLAARAARWMRRHKPAVSGAAALLLTAVAALAVGNVLIGQQKARAENNFQKAETERRRAEENFRLAHDAVDRYFVQVSESKLLGVPGMQPLRKELLARARDYFQQFVEQRADDPALRTDLATAFHRLAAITGEIESRTRAIELDQKALDQFQRLRQEEPRVPDRRKAVASVYHSLGEHYRETNQIDQAAESLGNALEIWEELGREFPEDLSYPTQAAAIRLALGRLYVNARQMSPAEKALNEARAAWQKLADANPKNTGYQDSLAWCSYNLGKVYRATSRLPQAEEAFWESVKIRERLAGNQQGAEFNYALASARHELAGFYCTTNRREKGLALYQEALAVYQRLAHRHPFVPLYQRDVSSCFNDVAIVHWNARRLNEAREAHEKAIAIQEELTTAYPDVPEYKNLLATSIYNLGFVHKDSGQMPDARAAFEKALGLQEELARKYPEAPAYQSKLADTHNTLGYLDREANHLPEAQRHLEQARDAQRKLVEHHPRVAAYKNALARSLANLAMLYRQTGQTDLAREGYQEACQIWEKLIETNQEVLEYRANLAHGFSYLGNLLRATDPAAAVQNLQRACAIGESLIERNPKSLDYHHDLGGHLNNLALALEKNNQLPEAAAALEKAVTHQKIAFTKAARVPQYRAYLTNHYVNLARVFRRLGRPAESADAALQRLALWPKDATEPFNVALDLAQCGPLVGNGKTELTEAERAERRKYEDQALAALRQAVANGFNNLESFQKTPELEPLRPRPEFRELVAQIEAKK
jgi:serine/threonine-protein kinase